MSPSFLSLSTCGSDGELQNVWIFQRASQISYPRDLCVSGVGEPDALELYCDESKIDCSPLSRRTEGKHDLDFEDASREDEFGEVAVERFADKESGEGSLASRRVVSEWVFGGAVSRETGVSSRALSRTLVQSALVGIPCRPVREEALSTSRSVPTKET